MSTLKTLYGTANQPITCTITSLADQSYRQSTAVDNSTNLYLDVLVTVKGKSNAAGVSPTGKLEIFAYASTDGSSYDGSCTGTDGSYTPPSTPTNLSYLGVLNLTGNAVTDQRTFSLAQAYGGSTPTKWGIVVYNATAASLDAAVGSAWYQGIQAQTV